MGNAAARLPPALRNPAVRGRGARGGVLGLSVPPSFWPGRGTPPQATALQRHGVLRSKSRGGRAPGIPHGHWIWPTLAEGTPKIVPGDKGGCKNHHGCPNRHSQRGMSEEQAGRYAEPQKLGAEPRIPTERRSTQHRRSTRQKGRTGNISGDPKKTPKPSPPHPRGRKRA